MNKKGLILIFFFVASTVSALTIVNAEQSNNKVEVTLDYVPSAQVDMGSVYVEFDTRYVKNSQVFTTQDIISFSFYYDVCVLAWAGIYSTGDGYQTDYWVLDAVNNPATWNYTVEPEYWEYNVTRFAGTFNLMLDDYDLGLSNFYIDEDKGNYQSIALELDVGWHYLTIVAAELVSNGNHTEWHWEYAKDETFFYVAETRDFVAPTIKTAYNEVTMTANAVNTEELGQYYTIDGWLSNPRPVAEATGEIYQTAVEGVKEGVITSQAEVNYNASDTDLNPAYTQWGTAYSWMWATTFASWTEMGPNTYMWWVNEGAYETKDSGIDTLPLNLGQNFVFFSLFGFKADDYVQYYADAYGYDPVGCVGFGHDMAVIRIFVGEPETAGFGFGILISVSMLGLVAALGIVRRRK